MSTAIPRAQIPVLISNSTLVEALTSMTIHNENFDGDHWSLGQSDVLSHAGAMVRREIYSKMLRDGKEKDVPMIDVVYTNWSGKTRQRKIIPLAIKFGSSTFHPTDQFLLYALDPEDGVAKEFALKDCNFPCMRPHQRETPANAGTGP